MDVPKEPFAELIMATYRWKLRTIAPNIAGYYYDIKNGLRALWLFRGVVWGYRPWDWYGMAGLLEVAARDMAACQRRGPTADGPKLAVELEAMADALARLREDDYAGAEGWPDGYGAITNNDERRAFWGRVDARGDADLELVCESMEHMRWWWN